MSAFSRLDEMQLPHGPTNLCQVDQTVPVKKNLKVSYFDVSESGPESTSWRPLLYTFAPCPSCANYIYLHGAGLVSKATVSG